MGRKVPRVLWSVTGLETYPLHPGHTRSSVHGSAKPRDCGTAVFAPAALHGLLDLPDMISLGAYEYNANHANLLGSGAFAFVYKGRVANVSFFPAIFYALET